MYLSRKERSKLLSFCSFSGDSWRDKRNNGRMDCSSVRALKVHNPPFRDRCTLCWRGVCKAVGGPDVKVGDCLSARERLEYNPGVPRIPVDKERIADAEILHCSHF